MTEYTKNQKSDDDNLPLSNNSREPVQQKQKEEDKKENTNKIEAKKEEKKENTNKTEDKKEEKKENTNKTEDKKNDVQCFEDIGEDIVEDDIDDINGNKNSGTYNNSQTVSASQGYDNTVDSHSLENNLSRSMSVGLII